MFPQKLLRKQELCAWRGIIIPYPLSAELGKCRKCAQTFVTRTVMPGKAAGVICLRFAVAFRSVSFSIIWIFGKRRIYPKKSEVLDNKESCCFDQR